MTPGGATLGRLVYKARGLRLDPFGWSERTCYRMRRRSDSSPALRFPCYDRKVRFEFGSQARELLRQCPQPAPRISASVNYPFDLETYLLQEIHHLL
jgi:hypothetical protein